MTAAAVLARAQAAGLTVVAEGGGIRLRGSAKPPADLLADLRANKADVLALLTGPADASVPSSYRSRFVLSCKEATEGAATPPDPAALLAHIRDALHCRVTLEGEVVTIRPTHRCPPPVLAAVQAVLPAVKAILEAEVAGALPALRDACTARAAALAGAYSDPEVLADRVAIEAEAPGRVVPTTPPAALVERLAAAMASPRPWQRVVGDAAPALAYFKAEARRRLTPLDGLARGLLVQAVEAEARRWAAAVVHGRPTGR